MGGGVSRCLTHIEAGHALRRATVQRERVMLDVAARCLDCDMESVSHGLQGLQPSVYVHIKALRGECSAIAVDLVSLVRVADHVGGREATANDRGYGRLASVLLGHIIRRGTVAVLLERHGGRCIAGLPEQQERATDL